MSFDRSDRSKRIVVDYILINFYYQKTYMMPAEEVAPESYIRAMVSDKAKLTVYLFAITA